METKSPGHQRSGGGVEEIQDTEKLDAKSSAGYLKPSRRRRYEGSYCGGVAFHLPPELSVDHYA
jgi:hypothetical protein